MATSTGAPSWGTCRVYGTWRNYDGTNKDGTVSVRIPHEVRNATDDVIIPAGMFIKEMALNTAASSVSFDQGLPANDDPDNAPVEWGKVEITVKFKDGADTEKYIIDTPVDGEVNLRTIIDPSKFSTQKAMLVRGVPGGVAGLDGNGDVIDADGNVITGGGSGDGGAVSSVNGATGAVVLDASDVGARPDTWTPDLSSYAKTTDLNGYVSTSSNRLVPGGGASGQILAKSSGGDYDTGWIDAPSGGAVDSVNGKTGVVTLDASDVNAMPTTGGTFTGDVKIGDDMTLSSVSGGFKATGATGGVLSVTNSVYANGLSMSGNITLDAGNTVDGRDVSEDGATLDTINGSYAKTSDLPTTASDVGALPDSINGTATSNVVVVANGASAPSGLPDGTLIVELDA